MSINDPNKTAKNPADITNTPSLAEPDGGRAQLAELTRPGCVPALAFRTDGKILLSLAYLTGADVSKREVWSGILLSEAESREAVGRLSEGADDAGSHVAAGILYPSSKRKRDDEPGEGGSHA